MKYATFIRGVGPENPNMHQEKLEWFFHNLGFTNVKAVISSGNVVFESENLDQQYLEKFIEENLPLKLNFSRIVIIRNQDELKKLFNCDPFNGTKDMSNSRLNITFLKSGGEVCSVINPEVKGTSEVMREIEKKYGKDVTMRTLKTIERILKKME